MKRLTIEDVKQRIIEVHGDEVVIIEDTFVKVDKVAKFIDKKYGGFEATPKVVIHRLMPCRHPQSRLDKTKKTLSDKYGVDCALKIPKVRDGIKKNLLNKHGVDSVFKIKEVKKKASENRKIKIKEIERRIRDVHGDIVFLDTDSYIDVNKKCRFIDKDYGEFFAFPKNVYSKGQSHKKRGAEKRKETMIKNHGVDHPMKSLEIARKNAKSRTSSSVLYHWKTGEELVCQGGWEAKVVEYFNKNKINFEWQSKIFTMPDGRTYTPDCYLTDADLWIEIKGRFIGDAEEKWNWFHNERPNSELWALKTLKEKNIL